MIDTITLNKYCMWLLQRQTDNYFLKEIDDEKNIHAVEKPTAAKTFDSEEQAEGYALALQQLAGVDFSPVPDED